MRSCGSAIAVAVAVLLLAGCGSGGAETETETVRADGPPQEVHVTLSGLTGPQDLGLLMADRRRFLADAGIYAGFASPLLPRRSVSYVLDGTDELGIARLPQVIEARADGAPLLVAGSVISHPTAAVIWLKRSGIGSLADLAGKRIGFQGIPAQEEFLRVMLARAGVPFDDVETIPVGYRLVPALLHDRVDAVFGSENIEGAELEARGARPVAIRPQDLGAPDYEELVLIARADKFAADPGLVGRYMAAVTRGVAAAVAEPRESLALVERSVDSNPETGRRSARAQLEATLPLLSRSGRVEPGRVQALIDWMAREGMIQRRFPVSELLAGDSHPE